MDNEPTEEQKARAQRHLVILYIVMITFVFLPLALFLVFGR